MQARGIPYDLFTAAFDDNDRAVCDGEGQGFAKVLTRRGTGKIRGGQWWSMLTPASCSQSAPWRKSSVCPWPNWGKLYTSIQHYRRGIELWGMRISYARRLLRSVRF